MNVKYIYHVHVTFPAYHYNGIIESYSMISNQEEYDKLKQKITDVDGNDVLMCRVTSLTFLHKIDLDGV